MMKKYCVASSGCAGPYCPSQGTGRRPDFDRAPQDAFDLVGGRLTEIAFTGDPHAFWEPATKCLAYNFFSFAVAIARREIEEINPGSDRVMYGRDAFVEGGRSPQHAKPAASQGKRRHRPQTAKGMRLHPRLLPCRPHRRDQHRSLAVAVGKQFL
jgi:hypothetical protein